MSFFWRHLPRRLWALPWLAILLTACALTNSVGVDTAVSLPSGDQAEVTAIIDGDTIDVRLNGRELRVRYVGVDTPERGDPFYAEASRLNEDLVGGETVILVKDVSETDPYGRLLRYVYLPDGTFVNAELLRQGMARRVTFPPDVAQQALFGELQEAARLAGVGIWAAEPFAGVCDCGGNRYNCADFGKQAEAQACFDFCLDETGTDVHRLDGGGDGLVCESLPE
ncbi:MAG: thermonuclease family protein [Anaerolineales bacterium]|nr:thermonuclease family protein [Anaerolineales bacterium]